MQVFTNLTGNECKGQRVEKTAVKPGLNSIRIVTATAVLSGLLLAAPGFAPEAKAACDISPQGKVLVMSNNVYEVEKRDARNSGDMNRFVDRMKEMAPTAPDIVLIQEARKSAVSKIRDFMAKKFGCGFSVPVTASRSGWSWIQKYWKLGGQDTAVIVNVDSMAVRSKGFLSHGYPRSDAAKGESVKVKKTAWVKAVEKPIGGSAAPLTVLAASAHYPRGSDFANEATNLRLKKKFTEDIARKLENNQSDGTRNDDVIHVIGGDMNNYRFEGKATNETPMYQRDYAFAVELQRRRHRLNSERQPQPDRLHLLDGQRGEGRRRQEQHPQRERAELLLEPRPALGDARGTRHNSPDRSRQHRQTAGVRDLDAHLGLGRVARWRFGICRLHRLSQAGERDVVGTPSSAA